MLSRPVEILHGARLTRGSHARRALATCGPGLLWIVLFLIVPLLAISATSFLSRGDYGEVQSPATFANYKRLVGFGDFGFDSLYPAILLRSVVLGFGSACLCLLCALPLAFYIASLPATRKVLGLTLVMIPFWTNLLIRTYAWQILLAPESLLTKAAVALGLLHSGEALYPSLFAVFIGMVCDYLPFMVLPLYASVEKIDWTLAEAAADLGASGPRVFWHAILPQIKAGLVAGLILVFLPATGQFVAPDLLGGAKTMLLGNAIQQQFGSSRDWPFGAAITVVALLLMLAGIWVHSRTREETAEELL